MAASQELLLGQMAVQKGLITSQQLAQALAKQERVRASTGRTVPVGELLVAEGWLSPDALQELLKTQAKPGSRELGGYELISRLGAGGMGAVYKARQKSLDRVVALKVLPPRLARDRVFIERFFREARAVARLNHPNIVQGIDVGEAGGYHYFAMELVEGRSLRDILEQRGHLEEGETLGIVAQVARALDHAHQNGLVHRDVKPDNVLIDKHGVAKLCDLGLARSTQEDAALTQTGVAMGTPHYIAPEQARGERDVDGRADLYSLGASWFHLLAGIPPFSADSAMGIVSKHLTEPAPPVNTARPGLSAGVTTVIAKLLAKERHQRYQSAGELLRDIADLKAGRIPRVASGGIAASEITVEPSSSARARDTRAYPPVAAPAADPLATRKTLPVIARSLSGALRRWLVPAAGLLLLVVLASYGLKLVLAKVRQEGAPAAVARKPGPETKPQPPANAERLAALEGRYQQALESAREHPDDLRMQAERWDELRQAGRDTKYQALAADQLRELKVRRDAAGRARLNELDRKVDGLLAGRCFGEAGALIKGFILEPGVPEDGPARLAAAGERVQAALRQAVDTVCGEAEKLAAAGGFAKAREALERLAALGAEEASDARARMLGAIDEAERAWQRRLEDEAERRREEVLAGLKDLIEKRDFEGALAEMDRRIRALPPDSAGKLGAERQVLAAAGAFLKRCRDRAGAPPPELLLMAGGVVGKVKSYDPASDVLLVFRQQGNNPEEGATGKARVAELEISQLLALAGASHPQSLSPDQALPAGCFLVLQRRPEQAEGYLAVARKGGVFPPELGRAVGTWRKTDAEGCARELLAKLEADSAAGRWKQAVVAGRELASRHGRTEFAKAQAAVIAKLTAAAEREFWLVRKALLPHEARVFEFRDEAAIKAFDDEFEVGLATKDGKSTAGAADGRFNVTVEDGDILHLIARKGACGREFSTSYDVDFADKGSPGRGHAFFGFFLDPAKDKDRRVTLLCEPGGKGIVSRLVEDDGREMGGLLLVKGLKAVALPGGETECRVRLSWKYPLVAWFVNGERAGLGKLPPRYAEAVASSKLKLCFSLRHNGIPGDRLKFKVYRVALGLPREGDFEGAEGLPEAGTQETPKPTPPPPQPQPQPKPPKPKPPPGPGPVPSPKPPHIPGPLGPF